MAIIGVVIIFGVGIGAFMLIYALWLGTTVSAMAGWEMAGRGVLVALVSVPAGVASQFLHWWFFT